MQFQPGPCGRPVRAEPTEHGAGRGQPMPAPLVARTHTPVGQSAPPVPSPGPAPWLDPRGAQVACASAATAAGSGGGMPAVAQCAPSAGVLQRVPQQRVPQQRVPRAALRTSSSAAPSYMLTRPSDDELAQPGDRRLPRSASAAQGAQAGVSMPDPAGSASERRRRRAPPASLASGEDDATSRQLLEERLARAREAQRARAYAPNPADPQDPRIAGAASGVTPAASSRSARRLRSAGGDSASDFANASPARVGAQPEGTMPPAEPLSTRRASRRARAQPQAHAQGLEADSAGGGRLSA